MILVTGGSGFLGAHLLAELTQKHERIRALYRDQKGIEKAREVFRYSFKQEAPYLIKSIGFRVI